MTTNDSIIGAPLSIDAAADGKFDELISLVMRRSRGEIGNDDVEDAITSIIGAPLVTRKVKNNDPIIPDVGNYDDESEGDEAPPSEKNRPTLETEFLPPGDDDTGSIDSTRNEKLEETPFGKMGERMLVTFGDGPKPHLDVITSALLGTRSCLQRAILDARALHRNMKEQWQQARAVAVMHRNNSAKQIKKTSPVESAVTKTSVGDSELSFRALGGIDQLRFDTPCGFNIDQLQKLFPEEMSAYQRWKKMHKAYTDNSGDDVKQINYDDDDNDSNNCKKQSTEEDGDDDGAIDYCGRLTRRLANFDARTNEMGDDSYLKFADNRRGSFLSRQLGRDSAEIKEWKENQKPKKRGRPKQRTNWQHLHHSSVLFLHWIGFDQRSALPPPNEETTQALGFLAYDFFGKIVEKVCCFGVHPILCFQYTRLQSDMWFFSFMFIGSFTTFGIYC